MRKYIFLTVLLVTGILAALHITAFAGEVDLIHMGEIRDSLTDEPSVVMNAEAVTWADTSDSYYDQLTGDAIQERFDKIVEDLVDTTEGLASAQRVAWWDNWLAANNAYNGAASSNQDYVLSDATPWLAMSSLLEGYQPACEGYTKGLQVLCHAADILCVQLEGSAGGGHMWNAIKLDGVWYFCDPTWDDPNRDEESWDYSIRTYLLSAPAATHAISYYPAIGTPTLSFKAYSQPITAAAGWRAEGTKNRVGGCELGSKIMILAIYDAKGKLLELGTCQSVQWDGNSWIYVSPAFAEETLEQAGRIVRINLSDLDSWKPWNALKTIL